MTPSRDIRPGLLLATALAALAPLLRPAPLVAQAGEPPTLEPGERVRARWGRGRVAGTLVERDGNLIMVRTRPDAEPRPISLAGVDRLEVWGCCTKRGGFWRGGLLGVGAVMLGGLVLQLVPTESANMALAGAVLMAPVGLVVGGVIGSATAEQGEGWIEVPVPGPQPMDTVR